MTKKGFAMVLLIWISGFWTGLIVRAIQHYPTNVPAVAEAPKRQVEALDPIVNNVMKQPSIEAPNVRAPHLDDYFDAPPVVDVPLIITDGTGPMILEPTFMLAGYMGADGNAHALTEADLRACQIPAAVGQ